MFERVTIEARAVLELVPALAGAAGRAEATPADLAAALCGAAGNTAPLWTGPRPAAPEAAAATGFDAAARDLLEQALALSVQHGAAHVGTEHLLAAVVRGGPADVTRWLAERGATPAAVDALLAGLHGGLGTEHPADGLKKRTVPRPVTVAAVILLAAVVFVLCIWGP